MAPLMDGLRRSLVEIECCLKQPANGNTKPVTRWTFRNPITASGTRANFNTATPRKQRNDTGSTVALPQMLEPTIVKNAPDPLAKSDDGYGVAKVVEGPEPESEPIALKTIERVSENTVQPRRFRSLQAIYLKPLKRRAQYGVPACDLQLRSYSVRNVEFFADFALRAAYYLGLPASGPVPLPRIVERWTVPRSNFIFKKSQENFERITMRRLIQIHDGHPESVELWLAFLRKHQYYGIGMKANVWQFESLGIDKAMDVRLSNLKEMLESRWAHFGRQKNVETSERVYQMMQSAEFKEAGTAAPGDAQVQESTT